VEDDVYEGSEGDIEAADSEDQIVTDELREVDDDVDAGAEAGDSETVRENDDDDWGTQDKHEQQEVADDAAGGGKTTRKRSHSKTPPAKDDFDDHELDSEVDETGTVCQMTALCMMLLNVLTLVLYCQYTTSN